MKIYFIFLCLFLSVSAIGQKHSISINYKPSFTYFGKQTQRFNNSYFTSRRGNTTFRNTANILYSYRLSSKIKITTGLEYSQQGQNINFDADSLLPGNNRRVFKIELNYLRIPLTIGYSIFKMEKSEFTIYSGLSIGIVTIRNDNYQNIILEYILLPPPGKRYKNQDWAVPIGINYQRALTKNTSAILGAEYLVGLTNSFTDYGGSKFGVLSEFDNSRQNKLSINIGIGFNLERQ